MFDKVNEYKWQKVGESSVVEHINPEKDTCFFLMNYEPGISYENSEANDRISNFKAYARPLFDDAQQPHRAKACQQFVADLEVPISQMLADPSVGTIGLAFVPTSKSRDSVDYDDRFEVVCRQIESKFKPSLSFLMPVVAKTDRAPASQAGGRRDSHYVEKNKANLIWRGFGNNPPEILVIIDDVVTSGGQFRAFSDLVIENSPQPIAVIGLFWAIATPRARVD